MAKDSVQNNIREKEVCRIFELRWNPERLGVDAWDDLNNPYELKSTTSNSVGTGRDVSPKMIDGWRKCYWIIAKGKKYETFQIEQIYFLSPLMMEERWVKIETTMTPDYILQEKVIDLLDQQLEFYDKEKERIRYLMNRGTTKNNPKISWSYIQKNGIRIEKDYANTLRKLVKEYPL